MSALLRRLADDDLDVVAAVLKSKAALQIPAAGLLEAVKAPMSRAWEALHNKEQGVSSSKALTVIKSVSSCHAHLHNLGLLFCILLMPGMPVKVPHSPRRHRSLMRGFAAAGSHAPGGPLPRGPPRLPPSDCWSTAGVHHADASIPQAGRFSAAGSWQQRASSADRCACCCHASCLCMGSSNDLLMGLSTEG